MITLVLSLVCLSWPSFAAVLGIDFGTEFIKVASVKPGMPFHIVVDEQTKRQIPVAIGFDKEQRQFASNAMGMSGSKPDRVIQSARRLLGKNKLTSPQVSFFYDQYRPYNLFEIAERNALGIEMSVGEENIQFSAEELMAMSFEHIKALAEHDAEEPVKDCVITVPEFFTQHDRQAMLDSAEIAGFNVLSLIDENTAAALQYAIDLDYTNETSKKIVFYNMGAGSTKVNLVHFSSYTITEKLTKKNKTIGQFEVLSVGYDTTLGSSAWDSKILHHIAELAQKKLIEKGEKDVDIFKVPKSMAKIFAQALRTKKVLSANTESSIYIDGFYKDYEFKAHMNRDQLDRLTQDLLDRVTAPLDKVLKEGGVKVEDLDALVIVGGGTRVPAVKKLLRTYYGKDLAENINADEAMAMGAVFRAANLSTAFKVRPIGMVGVAPFPFGIRLKDLEDVTSEDATTTAEAEGEETGESSKEPEAGKPFSKRAALFRRYNKLAKKKSVTLTHTKDMQVSMHHDNPSQLPDGQSAAIGNYNVTGLTALVADPANEKLLKDQEPKVSLSFALTSDGILKLAKAEAALDETIMVEVKKIKPSPSPVEGAEGEAAKVEGEGTETNKDAQGDKDKAEQEDDDDEEEEGEKEIKEKEEGEEGKDGEKEAGEKVEEEEKKEGEEGGEKEEKEKKKKDKTKKKKKKEEKKVEYIMEQEERNITRRFPLGVAFFGGQDGVVIPYTPTSLKESRSKLAALTKRDDDKKAIAAAKDNYERFIYDTRSKLEEIWIEVSTEEQREELTDKLRDGEDWLYEVAAKDETAELFRNKLKQLQTLSNPIALRAYEQEAFPKALNASEYLLNYTKTMIENLAVERPWVPAEDREKLEKLDNGVREWLSGKMGEQKGKQKFENPAVYSKELMDKLDPLAKYAQELLNRKKPEEKKRKKKE
eukprot:gb/GEZN01000390.1/.p1 GENE.gb/GEZN01000390.1/~~gb/GEZN01000390.1/.p1  ORF type:complete len:930 (-),score=242.96 gb/GEZN01000390.1/:1683-4472(-)